MKSKNLEQMTDKNLTFIVSYPKSGNTWVRYFLMAYIYEIVPDLIKENYIPRLESHRIFEQMTGLKYTVENFFRNGETYFSKLPEHGKFYKSHIPNLKVNSTPFFIPNARYICIYRNPLAIAPSFANHMGVGLEQAVQMMVSEQASLAADPDLDKPCRFPLGSWNSHALSWLCAPVPRLDIRYEDMSDDPDQHFRRILRFLGIEPEEGRFRFAIEATCFENLQAMEKKNGFREASKNATGGFFRSGQANPKKRLFSPSQRKALRESAKEAAGMLRYAL